MQYQPKSRMERIADFLIDNSGLVVLVAVMWMVIQLVNGLGD